MRTNAHGSIPFIRASAFKQQCELLGLPRSTYYYQPRPESAENLRLLRTLDEWYLKLPFFGSRKMAVQLGVGRHRARRLMRILDAHSTTFSSNGCGARSSTS